MTGDSDSTAYNIIAPNKVEDLFQHLLRQLHRKHTDAVVDFLWIFRDAELICVGAPDWCDPTARLTSESGEHNLFNLQLRWKMTLFG